MDKLRGAVTILGVALAAAYVADLLRHGYGAFWHLVFLLALVSPKLAGRQFGIDLDAQERAGTRDYLTRFRGMGAAQADRELARTHGIAQCVLLTALVIVESSYALAYHAWPIDLTPVLWLMLIAIVIAGAVMLGVTVFGVVYALRHLRS